ncbi:hypothetical protein PAMP_012725 [Pampus punctatissimus]
MPAVGADGKNIMKLIPVQMVNGKFVQTQMSKPKMAPKQQKATTIKVASAPVHMGKTAATQHIVKEQGSLMNASPRQVGVTDQRLDLRNSNKYPLQQQTLNLAPNCEKSVRLPVTVKSPALPRGQHLQIPSNAQVRTVPASELPPGLKKQIFTSSASSSSGLPSVVYVSPVMTVDQSNLAPERLSETSNKTLPSSGGFKPHLKLIPKVSQRPNSPIKWVIEEEESFRTTTTDPLVSPCVTSEILQAIAGREVDNKCCEMMTKETAVSPSSLAKIEKSHDNALVMCNGKVFFVAKKSKQALKLRNREADPPTAPAKSYHIKKTRIPSSQNSLRQDSRIIIPDESDEVIDLCNDDCPDDSSQQAAPACTSTVTHLDEDNVIFVSYIPPKSDCGPTQDLIQKAVEERKETEQTGTRSSDSVTERRSLDGVTSSVSETLIGSSTLRDHLESHGRVGSSFLERGKAGQLVSRASNTNRQESTSTQQMENIVVDQETESSTDASTSDSSSEICSQTEDADKMESSTDGTFSPAPCRMADHLLRRIFGITAVVKISLQRIDEENKSISKQSVEDVQETNRLKEKKKLYLQDLYSPQESDSESLLSVKRVNLLTEQEPVTPGLYADIRPIKCSLYKQTAKAITTLKSKHPSGQSSHKGILCDVETEPVIGYVEPIDDDLPSADENDIPNSQAQTCVNPNSNTRRMGRARKRTMCPCCIPGALDPAVKSSARLEEAERWEWKTEQTSKKGGRTSTKTRRKDGKRLGSNNCVTAKNKQSCSGSLSATTLKANISNSNVLTGSL